ncbi:hypothetical protein U1Q18_030016, partial [Sarracenia purpurea var. burkii]
AFGGARGSVLGFPPVGEKIVLQTSRFQLVVFSGEIREEAAVTGGYRERRRWFFTRVAGARKRICKTRKKPDLVSCEARKDSGEDAHKVFGLNPIENR